MIQFLSLSALLSLISETDDSKCFNLFIKRILNDILSLSSVSSLEVATKLLIIWVIDHTTLGKYLLSDKCIVVLH